MIGRTISHYRILSQLGEGGMGVVYVAEDTNLGRRVALKVPTAAAAKNYRARFLREARAVSALSHPHIAAVYDYGETADGQPFIVMELVSGSTLGDLLLSSALTIPRAVEIVEDVAGALAEAHERGIIHRDIKPSNILINDRGEVKVLDFGLAKQLEAEGVYDVDPEAKTLISTQTRSDVIVGTPLYLSPEQARGAKVDRRSDLFALGTLLYECLAGRPAFSGANVIEIGAQVLHVDPAPPSKFNPRVPAELNRITLKALAKKPEARYQSAEEFAADLRAVGAKLSKTDAARTRRITTQSMTVRSSALMTLSETLRRPRLSPAAFAATLLIVLLGVWGYGRLRAPTIHEPLPEAVKWYERGTEALRSGAYYQASKELEQAVRVDGNFALAHARLAEAWGEIDYTDRAKEELVRVGTLVPDRSALPDLDKLYLDAITHTTLRDLPRALEAYREIARRKPQEPQVYVDLGRAYEKTEVVQKAIESYIEATNLDSQYATAYLRLGILYGRQQDLASATTAFAKAEDIYKLKGNAEGHAEVLYERGLLFDVIGKVTESRRDLQQSLDIARTTANEPQQINALMQLSSVAFSESRMDQSQHYAREAVDLAQAKGMENFTTRGLANLGNAFITRGDYDEAEKYYSQSLDFARRYKGRRNEARAMGMLGSLRIQQGRTDEALRYIEPALAFYQQGGYEKEVSQLLTLLGLANSQKGDYEAALKAFRQQLDLAEKAGDRAQVAFSHDWMGVILVQQERYPEALGHVEEGYAISKSQGDERGVRLGLMNRGNVLWQLGRYEEARTVFGDATSLGEQGGGGSKKQTAWLHLTSARMFLSERRFPEAKARAQQSLALALAHFKETAIEARHTLGLAHALSGAHREGLRLCEEALDEATRLGSPLPLSKARLALAEKMLESGDARGALATVSQAQKRFAEAGQRDSEWRAWLIAARASRQLGDATKAHQHASRAADVLSELQRNWGTETFTNYSARPDVQFGRRQLDALLASTN